MDHGRAKQIAYAALAITWKWLAEGQHRDASLRRYRYSQEQAEQASSLVRDLCDELGFAGQRHPELREWLEQPTKTSDFDFEMLEQWLSDISEITGAGEGKLPGGCTSRKILYAWEAMHPIVRSEVERRLRNEPTRSILSALTRIPVLIDQEWKALKAARLPHVRVLLRRLDALLRQHGLGFGALASEHGKKSWSQRFSCLAQEAFGALAVPITRNHIQDERRREKNRTKRMPAKRQANRNRGKFPGEWGVKGSKI